MWYAPTIEPDEDVIDCPDRRTTVCEKCSQLRREKKKLAEKNDSLTKETGKLVVKNDRLTKELKGERLLRLGYAIDKGGGEKVSECHVR